MINTRKVNLHTGMVALLFIGILFDGLNSILSYFDEISTFFFGCYILWALIKRKIKKDDKRILFSLAVITILGVISNFISKLAPNSFSIAVDILWLYKVFFGFIGISIIINSDYRKSILLKNIIWIAKFFLLFSFPFALLNIFTDIGMSVDSKYGLRCYSFIVGNSGHYGLRVAACLSIIFLTEANHHRKIMIYTLVGFGEILLTLKMMPVLIVIIYAYLVVVDSGRKIMWKQWLCGLAIVAFLGYGHIESYISDFNHPRMRLLIYGVKTAMTYFPFGSGFATYGSEMANRYYSELYIGYGFDNFVGLSKTDGAALNDNYLAMIIGQFGFIGMVIFCYIMFLIYKRIALFRPIYIRERSFAMALFVSMSITSLMSGSFKSQSGLLIFMMIGLLLSREEIAINGRSIGSKGNSLLLVRQKT